MSEKTDTKKAPKGTKIKTYRREVTFDLTHEESERYGRELASKKRQRDSVVEKAKQTAANFKGQVADLSADIDRLAVAVDSGKELRSAEVEDWLDGSQVFVFKAGDYTSSIDQRPAGFADEQTDMFADPDAIEEEEPASEDEIDKRKKSRKMSTPEFSKDVSGDFTPPAQATGKKAKKPRKKKPAVN